MLDDAYLRPVGRISKQFGLSTRSIYRFFDEIKVHPRYKKAWITSNDCGVTLYNALVLYDYLHYRTELTDTNMRKKIPPYNPEECVWQLGQGNSYDSWTKKLGRILSQKNKS